LAQATQVDHDGYTDFDENLSHYHRGFPCFDQLQAAGNDADVDGIAAGGPTAAAIGVHEKFAPSPLNPNMPVGRASLHTSSWPMRYAISQTISRFATLTTCETLFYETAFEITGWGNCLFIPDTVFVSQKGSFLRHTKW
jgi:hypothetical protein